MMDLPKVRGFIHINPKSINIDTVHRIKKAQKLVIPVTLSARSKPIWEHSDARPDNALIQSAIIPLQERVGCVSIVET